jgi:hypothetical protein
MRHASIFKHMWHTKFDNLVSRPLIYSFHQPTPTPSLKLDSYPIILSCYHLVVVCKQFSIFFFDTLDIWISMQLDWHNSNNNNNNITDRLVRYLGHRGRTLQLALDNCAMDWHHNKNQNISCVQY